LFYERDGSPGGDLGLADAGHYAINSLRLEKGYRAWGAELSRTDTPLEAGLAFAHCLEQAVHWAARLLLKQKKAGVNRRLAIFILADPEPMLGG